MNANSLKSEIIENSILREVSITLEFANDIQKNKAFLKLKDTLYRQHKDPDYIFKLVPVEDSRQAES